ncbi:MAG: hypothetical protein A3J48_04735 [Candidatus Doudnabacteria bacterium RIFCSPHIGHO2_02_FULL_46_11]|uniref:Uncharacterized protein n=1 Tax=Candidatus Doudnabacteria bacterium RIFCSPHIGHO2_02_FULL_46_11 TaxID=1817832 RepID=A0A1F5P871_9BACT|nr:MAG: hypothetical protein A3J48_04735 [Candidatus Doudnabacteria bacterium RIFCSPHIGHO2_02_FULL_46_11]
MREIPTNPEDFHIDTSEYEEPRKLEGLQTPADMLAREAAEANKVIPRLKQWRDNFQNRAEAVFTSYNYPPDEVRALTKYAVSLLDEGLNVLREARSAADLARSKDEKSPDDMLDIRISDFLETQRPLADIYAEAQRLLKEGQATRAMQIIEANAKKYLF